MTAWQKVVFRFVRQLSLTTVFILQLTSPTTMKLSAYFLGLAISLLTAIGARAQAALRGARELQSSRVTGLQLVNIGTGQVIANLRMNSTPININSVGSSGLTIVAAVTGAAKSVKFAYGSNPNFRTESMLPYAMCGDANARLNPCSMLKAGVHTVRVTPFSDTGGRGTPGGSFTVTFSLFQNGPPVAPAPVPRPVPVPVPAPVRVPVPVPSPRPVPVPVPSPTSSCKVPKVCLVPDFRNNELIQQPHSLFSARAVCG
jgi:hypothetical protein